MDQVVKAILVLMLAFIAQYMWQVYRAYHTAEQVLEDVEVGDELLSHTQEFGQPEVIEVIPGVFVAIGYSLANSIMLVGPEGLVIVDTTEAMVTAQNIHKAFREKVPDTPIKAIVYTHNHADHTFGASEFIEDPDNPPDIWAYHTLPEEISRLALAGPSLYRGAMRQFGTFLPPYSNAGLGPKLHYDKEGQTSGLVMPNKLVYEEEMHVTIAGIQMKLYHIPGETDDHLGIWIPEKKMFLCGDDLYKAFPNLYAIRGTSARDNMEWVKSLDKIRELEPEYLVPSHTRPIIGKEKIEEIVTIYRDAIQYVHDQTVRYINKGLHPTEIAELVKLPPHMEQHPYLQQFYGTVKWSVKGVFDRYLGWFSGDPVELSPLSPDEKAARMIDLAGGVKPALEAATEALEETDFQWALQVSSYVFQLDRTNEKARDIRRRALKALAHQQSSPNGKSYYLTQILEDYDIIKLKQKPGMMILRLPLQRLFKAMSTKLKVEKCGEIDMKAMFNFTDISELYLLHLRNGIIETNLLSEDPGDWHCKMTTTELVFKNIVAQYKSPIWAFISGEVTIDGSYFDFIKFIDCLDKDT